MGIIMNSSTNKFDYSIVSNPQIFQQNRLAAHSDHEICEPRKVPGSEEITSAPALKMSLGGFWKFSYAENYRTAVRGFEQNEYDVTGWADIKVPGHIQMQGYDKPMYVNTQYPWDGHEQIEPGQIPEKFNPTATYVKFFQIPGEMRGREIHIVFQGVESGMALWLNGHYIGYSEDSFTPHEFDLTPFLLEEGENRIAVQVFKWTAGSWCEDQDFFRFSGIFREAEIVALPDVHVRDLRVKTLLDDTFTAATLDLSLEATAAGEVEVSLLGGKNNTKCNSDKNSALLTARLDMAEGINHYTFSVDHPALWSAEEPNLYALQLTVYNTSGEVKEIVSQKIGFRQIEIRDSILYLNGKRIVFYGVNRHEFSADSGRCITEDIIRRDLITMKRNNINAVRTCHYPNNSALYRLCDELGLYVIDETNLETHGIWDSILRGIREIDFAVPGDRPEFKELVLDRARSMLERDKNHACILLWSCGNESFGGRDLFELSELLRNSDGTRPVHYEGIFRDRRYNGTSDVESTMYATVADIKGFLAEHRDKPYIACEYSHAMGNSCGGLQKYTDLSDSEPLYQGGFIWDYIDQSITKKDRYGNEFQAYGGDFDDRPCDFNFSGNGIAYGKDRDPSPKMQEVKYDYQGIKISVEQSEAPDTSDELVWTIFNRNLFTETAQYECEIVVERNGERAAVQRPQFNVRPLETGTVRTERLTEDVERNDTARGDIYTYTMTFKLREDTAWARKGHEVAFGQYVSLPACRDISDLCQVTCGLTSGAGAMDAVRSDHFKVTRGLINVGVQGEHFEVLFSTLFGGLVSYKYAGREMLKAVPKPNFWRAPTDNDVANLLPFRASQWKTASMYASHKTNHGYGETSYVVEEREKSVIVGFTYHLPTTPATDCKVTYEVFADGEIETTLSMDASAQVGELPAFEMMFKLDADFDRLKWFGLGPEETYPDRCGAKLGRYENLVSENVAKYLVPQECGSKMRTFAAAVTDKKGRGIRFTSEGLQFSALPYTPQELENAAHPNELPPVLYTYVRIGRQMGIGGDDTWGALVHPEYLLDNSAPMEIRFRFKGI